MITRYWDSVVWLGILNEEPDKLDICTQLLEEARSGEASLVSSALTLTEVVHIQGGYRYMNPDKEATIEKFFDHDYIKIRNVDRRVGNKARQLVWRYHDIGLKPKDAIHAATAMIANVDVLNTYDSDLLQLDGKLPRDDGEMLKIEIPFIAQPSLFTPQEATTLASIATHLEVVGLPKNDGMDEPILDEILEELVARIEVEELEETPKAVSAKEPPYMLKRDEDE